LKHFTGVTAFLLLTAPATSAQLAILHARVWTGDPRQPSAQAILMEGNRIAAVGTDEEVARRAGKDAQVIDAAGRLVLPGFIDAHIHFLSGSLGLENVDLTGICTLESIQKAVGDFAKTHPGQNWITGRGWEYYCFPGQRLPTKEDLDAVVKDRPVFLSAYDGHTGWANSKALEMADINRATKFSGYGEIVKDSQGEPSGALKETAMNLVRDRIPAITRAQKLEALRAGLKLAASLGITSIQNASGEEEDLSLYEELLRNHELTLRVSVAPMFRGPVPLARIGEAARWKQKYHSPLLSVRAVKFVMDGVIESYTAAMLGPYADQPDKTGSPAFTAGQFNRLAASADKLGLQIYTHAIGDRAVRMALDGYEHALRINGKHDARFRVEHIETIDAADIPRFAELGVIASMQPIHCDPDTVGVWSKAVGVPRLPLAFPWRSLEEAGAKLVFSSDWPASLSVNPIRGIHNAVNRRTIAGKPPEGWISQQRVSIETAVRGYTTMGAYASFEEKNKGAIQPGMFADVIVLSKDLFNIAPMDIYKTQVDYTVFDGRVVYHRE
jgi:predicted amidohydrolase YtcJ